MSAPTPTIERVAIAARALGAIGVLVIAGRFAFVSAKAATTAAPTEAPSGSAPPARGSERAPITERPGEPRPVPGKGKIVRVTAMITLPPDQSEIFIDGARIGRTPYMGDVECEAGKRVRVKLVPPKGPTVELDRSCDSKDLEITKMP